MLGSLKKCFKIGLERDFIKHQQKLPWTTTEKSKRFFVDILWIMNMMIEWDREIVNQLSYVPLLIHIKLKI